MNQMYDELVIQNSGHQEKIEFLKEKRVSAAKKEALLKEFELEGVFLEWLKTSHLELKAQMKTFKEEISIVANKDIFPGVQAKVDENHWKAEAELHRCKIVYQYSRWKKLLL